MKLAEKIYQCRKKAGLSQEALATQLGVSRQAVSKWELGTAEPEPAKLKLLAQDFHVSVDWLLSEEEAEYTAPTQPNPPASSAPAPQLPGVLGKLVRRYGWLAGVYLIVVGVGGVVVGALARYLVRQMFVDPLGLSDLSASSPAPDHFLSHNPVSLLGGGFMIFGGVLLVAGIVLTVVLYRRSKRS